MFTSAEVRRTSMSEQHPVTPPPELVRHWSRFQGDTDPEALWFRIANEAAQWGADRELEACCKVLEVSDRNAREFLYAARRPNPPSLKEQALEELDGIAAVFRMSHGGNIVCDKIRRALEALPDD
jgi:hypothetical protein